MLLSELPPEPQERPDRLLLRPQLPSALPSEPVARLLLRPKLLSELPSEPLERTVLLKKTPLPLELAGKPFSRLENALPFRKDAEGEAKRDEVDAALTELKENGRLAEISNKWFGNDITTP